jgi:predicted protein tyrosine phosphatase
MRYVGRMAIRREILGFWWFREHCVGGMAQPGFNRLATTYPETFSAQENLLRNFLAKLAHSRVPLSHLEDYLAWWGDVVVPFLDLPRAEFERDAAELLDRRGFEVALERVNRKAGIVSQARWVGGDDPHLEVEIAPERVRAEIDILERHDFSVLVSMVETPPHPVVQDSGLEVHHLPVDDTTPPRRDQAEAFAEVLDRVYRDEQRMVVHCMAGIGRTATIIVAGHLLRGGRLGPMAEELRIANPSYLTRGDQWAFLQDLAAELDRL